MTVSIRESTSAGSGAALERIISRLHGVRRFGNRFRADCPNGHTKSKGSLSLQEAPNGSVLMHCFACGDTLGILSVLGLTLSDLYDRPLPSLDTLRAGSERRRLFKQASWASALKVASYEASVVLSAANSIAVGCRLNKVDQRRLSLAIQRLLDAREVMCD